MASNHAPRPCIHPGCGRLVPNGGYCADHQVAADQRRSEQLRKANQRYNRYRDESDKFYSTKAWRQFREYYLIMHPLCVDCEEQGIVEPAQVVDHLKPFKERPDLALDEANVRGLCRPCDNRRRHDRRGRD